MVIVDDHLALLKLADVPVDDVATTSLWYLRLVSAVTATPSVVQGPGRLARALASVPDPEAALSRILHPARTTLEVLHPVDFAVETRGCSGSDASTCWLRRRSVLRSTTKPRSK